MGDGRRWRVPLGPPIISFTADESEDDSKVDWAREKLEEFLSIDQQNIANRHFSVHFSRCQYVRQVDQEGLQETGTYISFAGNRTFGVNTPDQLRSIAPALTTLAFNFKAQGRRAEFMKLLEIAQMVPEGREREILVDNFPELFDPSDIARDT